MPSDSSTAFVLLHPNDNVIVALRGISIGEQLVVIRGSERIELMVRALVPAGHKIALEPILHESAVRKFGWPIGYATSLIGPGEHVHTHNVRNDHREDQAAYATDIPADPNPVSGYSFRGYRRANGKVGTRNYLAVISNVNCSASVARMIANRFDKESLAAYPNVDGVISFRHEGGCAMAWEGSRHRMLTRVLGGMARHPNIGGFLLVGLGCEQGTLDYLVDSQRLHSISIPGQSVNSQVQTPVLSMQNLGGTRATVERGVEVAQDLLAQVNQFVRTEVPASELILGTECGGSDGYSGITANPVLGAASDLLVACGGTTILSETTEIYGAEHLLTRRARTREVAEKLMERIQWWKWYSRNYGEEMDNNPSVGNKAGGLTTIAEKSLGAIAKGGTTALEAVYEYAQPIDRKGFVIVDSPGFDPASVTGMVASGANIVAFTTGRGSCFGFKPVPSFKIASNSALYSRLPEDMDFNAGQVLEGRETSEVGRELFEQLLRVASGEPTCSERLGIGDEEFVPWLVGPVL
ncbi:MAG: altronate dehydratase [Planctomycetales bacterium]|nr:altronate dehydratase [Planctomycetales bacterium]